MKDEIISVYEDRQVKLSLSEQQMLDILALKDLWGSQNIIMQADGTLSLRRYVGFIARNNTRLQILPKIFADSEMKAGSDEEKSEAVSMLFRLLEFTGYEGLKEIPDPQYISQYNCDLLEIYISLFVKKFIKLFSANIHRQYEMIEENIQFIKGKILFQKTILKNSFREHLHFVEYDEFTVNNLLIRIFKTIMLRLLTQTTNGRNKKDLKHALVYLDVDTVKLSAEVFGRVRFNRLNDSYRPLFSMAKIFYHNAQPGSKDGDEYTFTMLIPLNKLFEYFVYKLFYNNCFEINGERCKVNYQGPHKYLAICNGKEVLDLQPDITVSAGKRIDMIIDAKYKNLQLIAETDVYQVLAYAARYSCKKVYLVYPVFKGSNHAKEPIEYKISAFGDTVVLKTVKVDITEKDIAMIRKALFDHLFGGLDIGEAVN